MIFLDLQDGASVKSMMEKYKVTRPTVSTIRNTFTIEAEEIAESEGTEEVGEADEESLSNLGEADEESESIGEESDAPATYTLERPGYLPAYDAPPPSEVAPSPPPPVAKPLRFTQASCPEPPIEPRAAPTAYNVSKGQLYVRDKIKVLRQCFPTQGGLDFRRDG